MSVISDSAARDIAQDLSVSALIPDLDYFARTGGITDRLSEWAEGFLRSATRPPRKHHLAVYVREHGTRDAPRQGESGA